MAEGRAADTQVRGDGAAEQARQQDRAKNGGLRNRVEDGTDERKDSESASQARRISEMPQRFRDNIQRHQFYHAVEQQKHDHQGADDMSGPERLPGDRGGLNNRLHCIPSSLMKAVVALALATSSSATARSASSDGRT